LRAAIQEELFAPSVPSQAVNVSNATSITTPRQKWANRRLADFIKYTLLFLFLSIKNTS
jgi:hypothetical protein